MPETILEIDDLHKAFGTQQVLRGVTLTIERGSITTLIGKSGSGKTVLLKCIAGLIQPDAGVVRIVGESSQPALISYLFQGNALFDSMTAEDNVSLPLRECSGLSAKEISQRVLRLFEQLDLSGMAHKYPSELSGGMQRRVALARALVTEPEIILFDEPTTGLDPIRRNAVLELILDDSRKFGFTAIMVSHDVPESLYVSDQAALLDNGVIVASGLPWEFHQSYRDHPVVGAFLNHESRLAAAAAGLLPASMLDQDFEELRSRYETLLLLSFEIGFREASPVKQLQMPHRLRELMKELAQVVGELSPPYQVDSRECLVGCRGLPAPILESAVFGLPCLALCSKDDGELTIRSAPAGTALSLMEQLALLRKTTGQTFNIVTPSLTSPLAS